VPSSASLPAPLAAFQHLRHGNDAIAVMAVIAAVAVVATMPTTEAQQQPHVHSDTMPGMTGIPGTTCGGAGVGVGVGPGW
jgi:hypothetical protein